MLKVAVDVWSMLGRASGGGEPTAPVNVALPAQSGSYIDGQTLTATTGTWSGTAPITYAYQWQRDGVDISGATSATYAQTGDDIGAVLTCEVTATNAVDSAMAETVNASVTAAIDTAPSAFSLGADITDATLSSVYTSDTITPTGYTQATTISVTGGEYRIDGGSWTSAPGSLSPGSTVQVRGTSSGSNSTAVNVVLTIGGVSDTFTITTEAAASSGAMTLTNAGDFERDNPAFAIMTRSVDIGAADPARYVVVGVAIDSAAPATPTATVAGVELTDVYKSPSEGLNHCIFGGYVPSGSGVQTVIVDWPGTAFTRRIMSVRVLHNMVEETPVNDPALSLTGGFSAPVLQGDIVFAWGKGSPLAAAEAGRDALLAATPTPDYVSDLIDNRHSAANWVIDADGSLTVGTSAALSGYIHFREAVAPSLLAVEESGGGLSASGLDDGAFSVAFSGSSITAHNDTFTEDEQGRPLTKELLQSEWTLCLVPPLNAIQDDVASNGLVDPLDTVGLDYGGLWIYDLDQGVPPSPVYQQVRNGSAIAGEVTTSRRLGSADIQAVVRVDQTFGGNTVQSNALTVEDADPLAIDQKSLAHFDKTTVQLSGSDVVAWNDKLGSFDLDTSPTGIAPPTWDAINEMVVFDRATENGLLSSLDGPMQPALNQATPIISVFAVFETGASGGAEQVVIGETNGTGAGGTTMFGYDLPSATLRGYATSTENPSQGGRRIFGAYFDGLDLTDPPTPTGKKLWQYKIDTVNQLFEIFIDGVLVFSEDFSQDPDDPVFVFPDPRPLSLGGQWQAGGGGSRFFDGKVSQIYITEQNDPDALAKIQAKIASDEGITLP